MSKWKAAADVIATLMGHAFTGVLSLVLTVGLGTTRSPKTPELFWLMYLAILSPLVLWGVGGVMLVVWWRQGRRPLWPYPLIWSLAVACSVVTLIALCFPAFWRALRPPPLEGPPSEGVLVSNQRRRFPLVAKRVALTAGGVMTLVLVLGVSGVRLPPPETDVSDQKPYADFIGREYQVVSDVSAYAWNDFPDKATILEISLLPPPGAGNRFVSWETPLKQGQRVRIVSASRAFGLLEFNREYVVLAPGAGLPEGIPITMDVDADGVPDRRVYEPVAE